MGPATEILQAIDRGDSQAAQRLLPLVYDELRKLAAAKMAQEKPGQTLDATGLVHEAYLRLVEGADNSNWNGRGHFFAAAAEAMRRILVESARRRASHKRGGEFVRQPLPESELVAPETDQELLALDEALDQLAVTNVQAAELVKLRYFAGLTSQQAADVLGTSLRTAERTWAYARSWLFTKLRADT